MTMPGRTVAHHAAHYVLLTNVLTPWLRTRIDVTGGVVTLDAPRAILGILPIGRDRTTIPIGRVETVRIGWRAVPARLALSAALVAAAIVADPPRWLAVALLALGAALLFLGAITVLRVTDRQGPVLDLPICFFARPRARRVAARLDWIRERVS